jgi:superfamily I DNA and/or RNA helicase
MLDTQYRMHPAISAFPNRAFYASSLKDGLSHDGTSFDPPISSFLVPDSNVTFLDHDHPESAQSASLANYGDASITCNIIADLLYHNPTLLGSQIGIIAPYTAQVRVIGDYLLSDVARQEAFMDLLGEKRVEELVDIEIKTVDGFQGREKEVMIVSMVRCNPPGYVGFLGDWRRLNVALTRARRVSALDIPAADGGWS